MKNFKGFFEEYLLKRGISQVEAAEKIGISQQAISKWFTKSREDIGSTPRKKIFASFPEVQRLYDDYLNKGESTNGEFNSDELNRRLKNIDGTLKLIGQAVARIAIDLDEFKEGCEEKLDKLSIE